MFLSACREVEIVNEVVYRSEVRIERVRGPLRHACLPAGEERGVIGVHGEIGKEGGVMVIRRIHATYRPRGVAADRRDTVARVLSFHADQCPVARSTGGSIAITTSVDYAD